MIPGRVDDGAVSDAPTVDVEKYAAWFAWARDALHRELDATHAAAEAAYQVKVSGGTSEQARGAAEAAGVEPAGLDAETMAVAEWAAWARSSYGASAETSVAVARQAVARLQETHDLDAATREATAALGEQPRTEPSSPPSNGTAWIVAGVIAAIVLLSLAAAGLTSAANLDKSVTTHPPVGPIATMDVTVGPAPDEVTIAASGLPPDASVFIFVGDTWETIVRTDRTGSLVTTIQMPRGGNTVSICIDAHGQSCPTSRFVTRS